ncbi:MAG: alpha/beta hydrolase [Pseudomonadota bacterium]
MAQRIRRFFTLLFFLALATLLVALFKPIAPTIAPIQPRASTQYWEMAGGYRIAYTVIESGRADAMPVMYLHGGPGGYIHSSIIETLRGLADDGFDVYLYDQSGTGLSDRRTPPKVTSFAAHVADLKEIVIEQIGAERVHVIGHSAGGLIAAHFASANPGRVSRLVLSAPGMIEPMQFSDEGRWLNEQRYPTPPTLQFIDVDDGYIEATGISQLPLRAIASIAIAQLFNVRFAPDIEVDAALNTMASGFTRYMVCDPDNVQPSGKKLAPVRL